MKSFCTYKGWLLFLLALLTIFPLSASGKSEDSTGSVYSTDVTPGPGNGPMGPPPDGTPPQGNPPQGNPPQGMPMERGAADLEPQSSSAYFSDLDESTVDINAYVDYLYEKGLLTDSDGTGLFRPEDILTRGELAFMLYCKYQYTTEGFSYGDVPTTEYYYQAVMRGKASGVFEDTRYFNANEGVTREQAALWIYRSELGKGMPGEMASDDVSAYADGDTLSEKGQTAVGTLNRMGFFEPDGEGNFSPDREMTRAEIVSILYKLSFIGGGAPGMMGGPGGGQGMPGGPGKGVDHGSAAYTADGNITGGVFASTGDEENALRVDGMTGLALRDITIEKTGGEAAAGDASNFYGSNAAFLALNGAGVTLSHINVDSTADGGNGVFSYGEGTDVTLILSVIRTSGDNSGGVMVTGGGAMTVEKCNVETQGRSSAALRTDRGGGTLTVKEGTYKAHGEGSPAVYCTAAITVEGADLTATSSEAFVVEGKNSLTVIDCDAQGNMQKQNVENYQNVMIYQSMSGDAETGRSSFTMKGGSLTSHKGDMIYVTNTACDITLEDVELTLSDDVLLKVAGNDARNGWGVVGSNGGDCRFRAVNQNMSGNIVVDDISTLEMVLSEGSLFTGGLNEEGKGGEVSVSLDGSSRWILTGDSHITTFSGDRENIDLNGYALYIGDSLF